MKPRYCSISVAVVALLMAFAPNQAHAQGSCSAPQMGPGAVPGQGVGSLHPGAGWIQTSLVRLDTSDQFASTGNKEAYFAGRNLPAGNAIVIGYTFGWGGPSEVRLEDLFPER